MSKLYYFDIGKYKEGKCEREREREAEEEIYFL